MVVELSGGWLMLAENDLKVVGIVALPRALLLQAYGE